MVDHPDGRRTREGYAALIDLARHQRQSFQRQVTTSVYHLEGRRVLVRGLLQDTYHDMRMALLVDTAKAEIADIEAVMLRYPFTICPEALDSYRRLIGLKLFQPGTMRRIHELIPRRDGCTHLYHVLESCLRALFIGGRGGRPSDSVYETLQKAGPEERRLRAMENPFLKGTCLSFSRPPLSPAPDSTG